MAWVVGIGIALFLFFKFPKPMLGLLGVGVLGAVGIAGYMWFTEREEKAARNSIVIKVAHDLSRCTTDYPLFVTFSNSSARTLKRLNFNVSGYRNGYSDPILETGTTWQTDKIIEPNQTFEQCWSLPPKSYGTNETIVQSNLPDKLNWVGEVGYVTWEKQ